MWWAIHLGPVRRLTVQANEPHEPVFLAEAVDHVPLPYARFYGG